METKPQHSQDELLKMIADAWEASKHAWAALANHYYKTSATNEEIKAVDPIITSIGRSMRSLRDAGDLLRYPGAKIVNLMIAEGPGVDGLLHAVHPNYQTIALCGYAPPLDARIYSERGVPKCPECLKRMGVKVE